MTPQDLYLLVGGCLLTGFFAGIGVTLLYLRANLHLRSEAEWQRACMDDLFDKWEQAKQQAKLSKSGRELVKDIIDYTTAAQRDQKDKL